MRKVNTERSRMIPVMVMITKWALVLILFLFSVGSVNLKSPQAFVSSLMHLSTSVLIMLAGFSIMKVIMYVYAYGIHRDVETMVQSVKEEKQISFGLYVILSLLTFDLYTIIYMVRQNKRLEQVRETLQVAYEDHVMVYVLLWLLGTLLLGCAPCFMWLFFREMVSALGYVYNQEDLPKTMYERECEEMSRFIRYDPLTGEAIQGHEETIGLASTLRYSHKILFVSGQYAGASINLANRETIVLGRDGDACHVVFTDPRISKKHVSITYQNKEGCFIIHDYSKNGTYFENGQRLIADEDIKAPVNTVINLSQTNNMITLL